MSRKDSIRSIRSVQIERGPLVQAIVDSEDQTAKITVSGRGSGSVTLSLLGEVMSVFSDLQTWMQGEVARLNVKPIEAVSDITAMDEDDD